MSKTLKVRLVVGGNPEVLVDLNVWGKRKMQWRKDKDTATNFEFVDIQGLPETLPDGSPGFEKTRESAEKINVTNHAVGNGKQYPYTITVRYLQNGLWKEANTTYTAPPATGGRPVIRN